MAVRYYRRIYVNISVRNILLICFFVNYVGFCKTEVSSAIERQILRLLKPYNKLPNLPKNYVLSEDEVHNQRKKYLAGLKNEDIKLNGTQLIEKYGYNVEEHHATTKDGYILSLHRIPGKGPVVFLMHGFASSFVDWLTAGPNKGLPYLLAASNYDVWMGNARGNTYSKRHVRLSARDPEFWDFSWDEIGRFDLPAMIDYVLDTTGQNTLTYVGISQGTTVFYVACSERPEYNDKINLFISLASVAWMKHMPNPILRVAATFAPIIFALGKSLGLDNFAPDNLLTKALSRTLCGNSFFASTICTNAMFLVCGFDYPQIDFKQTPVIFNHIPSGSSLKQLNHYAQLVVSGRFRQYDHGVPLNLIHYKSLTPPSYAVERITVPVAMYYSLNDWLASPIDVDLLKSKLSNVVDYHQISLPTFNHCDFIWAKDVKSLVYDRVLKQIRKYNSEEKS